MELESYDFLAEGDKNEYVFYSEGPRGRLKKVIRFRRITGLGTNTYNLAFGDWDERKCRLDDRSVSNNNDRLKILNTVAKSVADFMMSRPNAIIWVRGSTSSRVRLYQMAVSRFWPSIHPEYQIFGKSEGKWLLFQRGVNYEEFLLFKKMM